MTTSAVHPSVNRPMVAPQEIPNGLKHIQIAVSTFLRANQPFQRWVCATRSGNDISFAWQIKALPGHFRVGHVRADEEVTTFATRHLAPPADPVEKIECSQIYELTGDEASVILDLFPSAKEVDLSICFHLFDEGKGETLMKKLVSLQNLKSLNLSNTGLQDDHLAYLQPMSKLEKLVLSANSDLTGRSMDRLQALTLTDLDVGYCKNLTNEGVQSALKIPTLRSLDLSEDWGVTAQAFDSFFNWRELKQWLTLKQLSAQQQQPEFSQLPESERQSSIQQLTELRQHLLSGFERIKNPEPQRLYIEDRLAKLQQRLGLSQLPTLEQLNKQMNEFQLEKIKRFRCYGINDETAQKIEEVLQRKIEWK